VRLIVASLFASRLTLLYGPSGVGKSSVLHAGAVPQLEQRRNVLVVSVREWSQDPARSLSEAAARAAGVAPAPDLGDVVLAASGAEHRRVMLVLDQFEHALAEDADGNLVEQLATTLLRPDLAVSALIAIREDALAELDRFEGRLPGIFDVALRLEYLDREAGADAIRAPLRAWAQQTDEQVEVEDALVDAVLDAVPAGRAASGVETAQLQLVMARVWEAERDAGSSLLRERTFAALGGADGIVREHVRDALDAMPAAERDLASVVLDRLVTPSGARIAHLTGDLADYAHSDTAMLRPVLERLSAARVLRPVTAAGTGAARFEVYHELLADAILAWLTEHEAARREALASARSRKRVLSLVAVAAVAVVVAVVLAGALIAEKRSSETASSRATSATARRLLESGGDPQVALGLALRAVDTRPTREAQLALRAALAQSFEREVLRTPVGVRTVDISPDGRTVLTAEADGRVRLRDRRSARLLRTLQVANAAQASFCPEAGRLGRVAYAGDTGAGLVGGSRRVQLAREPVDDIACSADGNVVAVRTQDHVRIFDPDTGVARASVSTPTNGTRGRVEMSADGRRLVANVAGGAVVVDLHGHQRRTALRPERREEHVASVAITPAGDGAVTGGVHGTVLRWDVARAPAAAELPGLASSVGSVAYGSDGRLVLAAADDRTARVWDAETGVALAVLRGHESRIGDATFAPDGQTVVTASDDRTVRLWRLPGSTLLRPGGDLAYGAFTRAGRLVVTVTTEGSIELWDAVSRRGVSRVTVPVAPVAVAATRNASAVAILDESGRVLVWKPGLTGTLPVVAKPAEHVRALDFSDGGAIALAAEDGALRIADASGRTIASFRDPALGSLTAVAFSPDGRRVAVVAGQANAVVLVDARSGRRVRTLRLPESSSGTVAFAPDGSRVIAGGGDGALIWDAATGRLLLRLRGHSGFVMSATFDAGGDLVTTADSGGEVRIQDAASGDLLAKLAGRAASFGGERFVLTTGVGSPRLYACDICGNLRALVARGRGRITRPLTDAQVKAYAAQ
jgi:WD40 repeat protein